MQTSIAHHQLACCKEAIEQNYPIDSDTLQDKIVERRKENNAFWPSDEEEKLSRAEQYFDVIFHASIREFATELANRKYATLPPALLQKVTS